MVLAIDYDDTGVVEWRLTADGVERTSVDDYCPTLYVGAPVSKLYGEHGGQSPRAKLPEERALTEELQQLRAFLDGQAAVESLSVNRLGVKPRGTRPAPPVEPGSAVKITSFGRFSRRIQ